MEAYRDVAIFGQGVGATAEASLVTLSPLIEYYEREMGELPGRLMIAASFLEDIKLMDEWSSRSPAAQAGLEQAKALVVSVMVRMLNTQQDGSFTSDNGVRRDKEEL